MGVKDRKNQQITDIEETSTLEVLPLEESASVDNPPSLKKKRTKEEKDKLPKKKKKAER